MTDEPAVEPAKKRRIEPDVIIVALQAEADRYRAWADAVSDGNRSGLLHRAEVIERGADAVAYLQAHEAEFREWQRSRRRKA